MGILLYLIYLLLFAAPMALAAFGVSWALTKASIQWSHRRNHFDEANERSSHSTPTPRLGGVGICGGLLVGFGILAIMLVAPNQMPAMIRPVTGATGSLTLVKWTGMLAAFAIAFGIGLWDDLKELNTFVKLGGQILASIIPPIAGLRLTQLHIPGMHSYIELHPAAGIILSALIILGMMNVVNFMDGINGLVGRFGQFTALAITASTASFAGWETLIPLLAVLYGAIEGFLTFNTKGETFMGDCGSQPLGLYIGLLGIHLCSIPVNYTLPLVGFLIIVSPFIYDVAFTLVRRLATGKNLFEAHRDHLYQRFLVSVNEDHVATRYFVENYLIGAGIIGFIYIRIFFSVTQTVPHFVLLAVTVGLLVWYTIRVQTIEKKGLSAA